ncbi:YdbL family protein [Sphingopyxis sp. R3-92]|uniref:YdbL family protein n=1 Tax=Sphingopyxis sp. R3-92 TaxID=3158553 RepID=UPI003EE741AE
MRLKHWKPTGLALAAIAATAAVAFAVPSAMAQRDPAYAAARAAGQVGEQPDGYLGFASSPTPAIRALVEDLNIKRKAAYTERAQATGSTVQQFAFTSGCNLIAQTKPGEKYQAPDGSWKTRDGSPPVRDSRCP